ncbi:ABC transporter ATP-binding protein|uniref:Putative ABC transport system ATP-binding protein n=1 Tax=Dendrosporobacter quercicolus TaxID=146817 RepID=A0A1G9W5X3_9FIRM|nr:ABC transporter ATP-binding protein [Dendrosporobacter quercicolus]NSL47711.1 ABC transporter ATP-binding protein [Dendrosporobacter quercicolus DSM 1736]SDM79889.1 putative ABC transport system ATP-binding protein [Dendrosporobacter quercicolus]
MGIVLNEVKKHYQMGGEMVAALDGISLEIKKGEFVAIMGPSGSGKSTMMNILGCLDRPSSGSYLLDGREVATLNDDQLAKTRNQRIGFVFQNFNLLSRVSAWDNVALPLVYAKVDGRERLDRAAAMLDSVGLNSRKNHLPNELSGGQRQRVAIARALINDPSIIMADEPTGNLDSRSSIEIMKLFSTLYQQGRTVILVTHEPDIAAYARRAITVRDGLIISDKVKELDDV